MHQHRLITAFITWSFAILNIHLHCIGAHRRSNAAPSPPSSASRFAASAPALPAAPRPVPPEIQHKKPHFQHKYATRSSYRTLHSKCVAAYRSNPALLLPIVLVVASA
eukprot:1388869-Rhodomonas_salina.2